MLIREQGMAYFAILLYTAVIIYHHFEVCLFVPLDFWMLLVWVLLHDLIIVVAWLDYPPDHMLGNEPKMPWCGSVASWMFATLQYHQFHTDYVDDVGTSRRPGYNIKWPCCGYKAIMVCAWDGIGLLILGIRCCDPVTQFPSDLIQMCLRTCYSARQAIWNLCSRTHRKCARSPVSGPWNNLCTWNSAFYTGFPRHTTWSGDLQTHWAASKVLN